MYQETPMSYRRWAVKVRERWRPRGPKALEVTDGYATNSTPIPYKDSEENALVPYHPESFGESSWDVLTTGRSGGPKSKAKARASRTEVLETPQRVQAPRRPAPSLVSSSASQMEYELDPEVLDEIQHLQSVPFVSADYDYNSVDTVESPDSKNKRLSTDDDLNANGVNFYELEYANVILAIYQTRLLLENVIAILMNYQNRPQLKNAIAIQVDYQTNPHLENILAILASYQTRPQLENVIAIQVCYRTRQQLENVIVILASYQIRPQLENVVAILTHYQTKSQLENVIAILTSYQTRPQLENVIAILAHYRTRPRLENVIATMVCYQTRPQLENVIAILVHYQISRAPEDVVDEVYLQDGLDGGHLPSDHSEKSLEEAASDLLKNKKFSLEDLRDLLPLLPIRDCKKRRGISGGPTAKVQSFLGGLWNHGGLHGISKDSCRYPKFVCYVNEVMKRQDSSKELGWSSFIITKNVATSIHRDAHNLAGSPIYTVSVGEFSGGHVWVERDHSDDPLHMPVV
ncbi:GIP [Symbiodinium sp. KB8]|nr:GIP [Symbiodinium sp. KB8]